MEEKGLKNKILSFLKYFILLIIVFCFLSVFFIVIFNVIEKKKGNKPIVNIYTIITPSMIPTINVYDSVVDVRVTSDEQLKVGDIITFHSNYIDTDGYTITHRIVKKQLNNNGQYYYITKGDNNESEDRGYIFLNDIEGKVLLKISQLGKVQEIFSSKYGWTLFILIPAIYIIIDDIIKIIRIYKIRKQIESIPEEPEVEAIRNKEDNDKLKDIIERANDFNNKGE